jgi:plasmid stability protein
MPSITIRDVPDDVHRTLTARAARAGMSLQEYLRAELSDAASTPTLAEVLDRMEARKRATGVNVPSSRIVEIIREERGR